jgi:RNA 3'-terminal phosphate cyclase-like protein
MSTFATKGSASNNSSSSNFGSSSSSQKTSGKKNQMKFTGCTSFRQRITSSLLSGKSLKIDKIRGDDENPGLHDFEASFLHLVNELTDGTSIEINEIGTALKFRPGVLMGGTDIEHDCGTMRSIGWFIEGLIPLAIFCKSRVEIKFTGVTNDAANISVDTLRDVTLPILRNFGITNVGVKIKKRGAQPRGGGEVLFFCQSVRDLKPINVVEMGLVKRVRGTIFSARVSPTVSSRVVDSARAVLNNFLPDVFIHSDHCRGAEGGLSAGYSISLIAESTTGALLSVDQSAQQGDLPEDIGRKCAIALLEEVKQGGVIDSCHQSLILQLMVLGPEDVCKVRFGSISEQAVRTLRLLYDVYGVTFKITEDEMTKTLLLSCLGMGFKNMSRRVK